MNWKTPELQIHFEYTLQNRSQSQNQIKQASKIQKRRNPVSKC